MDAARYFEEMHLAMSRQKPEYRLVLSVKVQDLGGADAYQIGRASCRERV